MWSGYLLMEREIVGIPHPAVTVRVFDVVSRKVDWGPAFDRVPHIVHDRDDDGEDDEE